MRTSRPVLRPVLLTVIVAMACASQSARAPDARASTSCRVSLGSESDPLPLPAAKPALEPAPSRIVADTEFKLARLASELEANISRRLAAKSGASLGVAGTVDYTVDRGPLSLAVEDETLVVQTDVQAHAQACKRGHCYASCDPTARVQARVSLKLTESYRFAPSRVSATFTRGCKIRTLGGFLTIDLTPTLEAQLAPELERVAREIDGRLPNLRPRAERLWAELGKERPLPLGGCVVVQPSGFVQGPVQPAAGAARLRFALLATPEVRSRCGAPAQVKALPPLGRDPALPSKDDVTLGLVVPLTSVQAAFQSQATTGSPQVKIDEAQVTAAGALLDAALGLSGEVCGKLVLRASPAWSDDAGSLVLSAPELSRAEAAKLDAAALDHAALSSSLASVVRVPPPLAVGAIDDAVPLLAKAMSDDSLEISAAVEPARTLRAAAREGDLVGWVSVRGGLTLKQK